ncbi:hypothetical protein [Marinobacter sp. CHS3-4]|uniref:hypothetical protein n=1 Tax=Marinobacter sp. CHS3-4 TaxID=3045174 RepID=UPI0024B5642D|nr:hypothetical protein [Marinobacter sp. CHS3-4]MDI9244828.1 hypothetical protein [Marinobacter sp. CHS3-4]
MRKSFAAKKVSRLSLRDFMSGRFPRSALHGLSLLLIAISSQVSGSENITMRAPAGSQLVSQSESDAENYYRYTALSNEILGEQGLLVQHVLKNRTQLPDPTSLNQVMRQEDIVCDSGKWSDFIEKEQTEQFFRVERLCTSDSNPKRVEKLLITQALSGSENLYLVSYLWTPPESDSPEQSKKTARVLREETEAYLDTIKLCDGAGQPSCQQSVDDYLKERAKHYIENRL